MNKSTVGHFFIFTILVVISIREGNCLECYKCSESFKRDCYYGNIDSLDRMSCAKDDVCITYQYETTDLSTSNSYITTARGCTSNDTCSSIMDTLMTRKEIQKGVLCDVCQRDFCNYSTRKEDSLYIFCIALLSHFIKYMNKN
ncbi:unnamed protein product [Acanthoscelides obtectus]|uniref:Protein sleepless n=1 Tax=Acanthoscelides obtectus TaxID=200917 RepID=A0A9P0LI66_ACAOB|nr:unnamed protein product [Acanthoscelides obtectus]CAK1679923.1 hypothetical protein AOBTE_LOCUS32458 [Acanthoscelides obtectus]